MESSLVSKGGAGASVADGLVGGGDGSVVAGSFLIVFVLHTGQSAQVTGGELVGSDMC
ncbi:hypothetical protein BCR33DRAFT_725087 [Rhizoclosmatium globosum]|uniref:Uncharacterized protein n=1 Tax=Rhizoclosmatium globosum TaxID=329046 RepID=A0A1Y2B0P1_9FUNG|nr:hypothetical protein BCR33DRAFT_725087 [Rhizoclosmatium globosum]|eukprot:ORY28382.1 hypothetical protein BCR33DRAFT_725087 [Rhizoclosmatium globosum]